MGKRHILRRLKEVRFCNGVSANLVGVICPIYLLFSTTKFDYSVFWPNCPQKCVISLQNKLSQFLPFYPLFSEMHHIFGVLELENLVFCCSPLHAFFFCLKNSLFTPLVSKMLQNDTIFLFVLRGLAIRDMQQRNSLQLNTASEHSDTSKNRMQSISTFCASRREAIGMRGLAILTFALGSVESSSPLIVADSFVHASVPSAELCMRTLLQTRSAKGKGGTKSEVAENWSDWLHHP